MLFGGPLAIGRVCEQIARHENHGAHGLHYLLHYYPLTLVGGAVFFILMF